MALNINSDNADPYYRYKMPRLIAKVEGKGNGIKTVVVNMVEIAKALQRPPTYTCKFFGVELGAQTQMDAKSERYIVNGAHEAVKLQELLGFFIRKFVLCPNCDNPETDLTVKKGHIQQKCKACGHVNEIPEVAHKLTGYIIKNPPDVDPSAGGPAKTGGGKKVAKKAEKANSKKTGSEGGEQAEDSAGAASAAKGVRESGVGNTNGAKSASRSNGVIGEAGGQTNGSSGAEEDEWGDDASEEASRLRMAALSGAAKALTLCDDLNRKTSQRLLLFRNFLQERITAGKVIGNQNEVEICQEASRLEVREKVPAVAVEMLLTENIIDELKRYKSLFERMLNDKKAKRSFLSGLEVLIAKTHAAKLVPRTAVILKFCYDQDLLDEDVLLEWDEKPSTRHVDAEQAKQLREKASALMKWLREAEEEESSEEDEDEPATTSANPSANGLAAVSSAVGGDTRTPPGAGFLEEDSDHEHASPGPRAMPVQAEVVDIDAI